MFVFSLILQAFLVFCIQIVLSINTQNGADSTDRALMKCGIYHTTELFGFIVLDFRVNVHSCLAVLVPCKILNRLGINSSVQEIGDIGMSKLVRRYIKIQAVNDLRIVLLMLTQCWIHQNLNGLAIHILITVPGLRSSDNNVLPHSLEL